VVEVSSEERPLFSVEVVQVEDKLVVNGKFRYSYYESEEIDASSVHDFYIKVLRGRVRIKARVCRGWKEYVVTPLSEHVVVKVEEIHGTYEWWEPEEVRIVKIYEYRNGKWQKLSEHVKEEW
jgi:hypothetical protein